jgi:hypothetical protein
MAKNLTEGRQQHEEQQQFRELLFREWDDITALILKKIEPSN